jgi:hypothetical protein
MASMSLQLSKKSFLTIAKIFFSSSFLQAADYFYGKFHTN